MKWLQEWKGSLDFILFNKKGNPTYVAVWEEIGGKINLVEVTYAGTHEKSPY